MRYESCVISAATPPPFYWAEETISCTETPEPEPALREALCTEKNTTCADVKAYGTGWIDEAFGRLMRIAGLPAGWDDHESPRTDPAIVAAAAVLLERLNEGVRSDFPIPWVCPIAGGRLQFEWTSSRKHLEIEFLDDHRVTILKERAYPKELVVETDESPLDRVDRIRQILDWFASV